MNNETQELTQSIKCPEFQYIQLTRSMEFRESPGRDTLLLENAHGFFIEEVNIDHLHGFTNEQKEKLLNRLKEARDDDQYLALVAGYPIVISENDFVKTDPPKITPVPTGLVCGEI